MVLSTIKFLRRILLICSCLRLSGAAGNNDDSSTPHLHKLGEYDEESGFFQSIATTVDSPIFKSKSKYQEIEIHKSKYYGKILVLDGVLQLTERDADAYNEMMAHVPMFQHQKPKRVLVVGGGDGYVLSEILKHESVERVDHVDLDGDVVEVCKEHFSWGGAWSDPRVTLHVTDGATFVKNAPSGSYDVIVQDSSDPWTHDDDGEKIILPSSVLYKEEHFRNLHRILKPNGILNLQAETFALPADLEGIIHWRHQALELGFYSVRYGTLHISSYPTGQIGFLLCEKSPSQASKPEEVRDRYQKMIQAGQKTSYYHARLQRSAFDLPLWVHEAVYGSTDLLNSVCLNDTVDEIGDTMNKYSKDK